LLLTCNQDKRVAIPKNKDRAAKACNEDVKMTPPSNVNFSEKKEHVVIKIQ
jgi:hypothetical protein